MLPLRAILSRKESCSLYLLLGATSSDQVRQAAGISSLCFPLAQQACPLPKRRWCLEHFSGAQEQGKFSVFSLQFALLKEQLVGFEAVSDSK